MEVGKIYKFHGDYEHGDVIIGRFEGIDNDIGFMKFSKIVWIRNCTSNYDTNIRIIDYAKHNKINEEKIMSEFERFLNGENSLIPKAIILHEEALYNVEKTASIIPMKNYVSEL